MTMDVEEKPKKPLTWWSSLCEHIKNGDVEQVEELLEKHHGPEATVCTSDRVLSDSPLHTAVVHEKVDILEFLISRGLDVNVTNLYGETALHLACRIGNTDIVKMLLKAGNSLNDKDCGECTPLFHAIFSRQTEVVDLLIRAGCDVDTLNEELISPLDHAVLYDYREIISLLLKGGCAIDKTAGMVYYPGHYANSLLFSLWVNSDLENIEFMINAGYNVSHSQIQKLLKVAKVLVRDDSFLHNVKELISKPKSLSGCCRINIRRCLMVKKGPRGSLETLIQILPLPVKLKEYLCLR